ncbi:MAG: hypothetical protein AB7E80_10780 [Hyphomicrobiaceae bacterium]
MSFAATVLAATAATGTIYSDYPAFLKRGGAVEAWTDRGPIIEIIVRCRVGTGIVSYSKIDGAYCAPRYDCHATLRSAIRKTCR